MFDTICFKVYTLFTSIEGKAGDIMKFGMRTPSLKKSISARTTGRLKRSVKKAIIPLYGKRGIGIFKNPKKAVYNRIYGRTTVSVWDLLRKMFG